jgi:hypothetical protein
VFVFAGIRILPSNPYPKEFVTELIFLQLLNSVV